MELKLLLESWWPQLSSGTVAILLLAYSLMKSGKLKITLFAPTQEKAAINLTETLLGSNVTLMEKNLDAFSEVLAELKKISQTLREHLAVSEKHLDTQHTIHLEVAKQTTILQVRSDH